MKYQFGSDPWILRENVLNAKTHEISESITSQGNGHFGMRGNFEEQYSGVSLQGTYIAGVYYPDKTRVGWWKNGYPEYFAKVLNAMQLTPMHIQLDGQIVDLASIDYTDYVKELDMRNGVLTRRYVVKFGSKKVHITFERFLSMADRELGVVKLTITPVKGSIHVELDAFLNGDIRNADANYDEFFWDVLDVQSDSIPAIVMKTKKTAFTVAAAMQLRWSRDGSMDGLAHYKDGMRCGSRCTVDLQQGESTVIEKFFSVVTSRDWPLDTLLDRARSTVDQAWKNGYDQMLQQSCDVWSHIWQHSDILIEGDDLAQQGIRFNIFQLNQTYTGHDSRLNIGPKGFTGEKYGGSTYWDTEAYCIPFYLSTADPAVARNLLIYRHNHLQKAIENAAKLGLDGALYPMVTMNGEECHNEWEITFEEIHRNAAITYAIYNYVEYTGDVDYLHKYGLDVLVETSRFWQSRAQYHQEKDCYMILGVTGPNEYDNNVNNNWYTNTISAWSLEYTLKVCALIQEKHPDIYVEKKRALKLTQDEMDVWSDMVRKMYRPYDSQRQVFVQQDGFFDKALIPVSQLRAEDRPINQNWSWDRILRSCYIKQADVLQGMFFLGDRFTTEEKRRNFLFYDQYTVHESSLSPCIYSILASEIGEDQRAYELYLRTSRLDLDNYNNDTEDGLHITSMGGTWMSVVYGFGGLRWFGGQLSLSPKIPSGWTRYAFTIVYRNATLAIEVNQDEVTVSHKEGHDVKINLYGKVYHIYDETVITVSRTRS